MNLLTRAGAWLRARLVRDVNVMKLWSVQISALGSLVFGFLTVFPVQALAIWNALPPEVQAYVPNAKAVALGLITLAGIARVLKQGKTSS